MGVALMPDAATESAERACAAGECEKAINLLEAAVRQQPDNFRLHYMLGLCYGGGCRRHSLTHPDMAVPYLRKALRLLGAHKGRARAAVLDELGNTLVHSRNLPRDGALRAAMECHREAAELYESLGSDDDWARAHFNLGNSCCELSEVSGEDHWLEAVSHYRKSLRIRTRDKDPDRHAAVLENLGTAYRRLPAGSADRHVKECIQCYRQALRVYALATHPEKNAALQNNLGNAFLSLPETDESTAVRNAWRALRHFDRALRVQSGDKSSRAYGITQYNCAQAYFRLARAFPALNLNKAVACLEDACTAFESCGEERYTELIRAQLERICRA
jgi:tetratricopeptide (TPR) repeat protein